MASESVEQYYDKQYRLHKENKIVCPNSLHDTRKATRRVNGALRAFNISTCRPGGDVLDVGCGLGYYTKALTGTGAKVTGLDFSQSGVEVAKATFPDCHFQRGSWPEDVERNPCFDLIWCVNFSLINTFDIALINTSFITEAMTRLKPGGWVVVGWNTDFSGKSKSGYCSWSLPMLREMREVCGLSAPRVVEASSALTSWAIIYAGRALRRSIPIYMARQKSA